MLDTDAFCKKHPVLYHVAAEGSWPQIERHGLLSVNALLDLHEVDEETRFHIEETRRSRGYVLSHDRLGNATIRDQVPLNLRVLSKALDGMTVAEWRHLLDSRVFLFPTLKSAEALMCARFNRDKTCLLIEADSREIFDHYIDRIEVADINTGTASRTAPKRGKYTFQSPGFFQKTGNRPILEVTVLDRITDIKQHVRRVTHYRPLVMQEVLYARV